MMINEKIFCLLLILPLNTVSSEDSILSSCSSRQDGTWNKQNIGINLRSWLKSVTTIRVDNQNGLKSMRYYPLDKSFGPYSDMEDLADFHDNPTDTNNETDEDENLEETDSEKGFTTIGHFENDIPKGFAWQWQSERLLEGFLFGKVNETGSFTGNDIIYIYPDFQTGLRGQFEDGFVVAARPVSIIGERCQDGIKEILTSFIDDTIWTRQISNSTHISNFPKIMDPHEKKSVFLGNSAITGGGEGIFARRSFMPGQLVSYFNGIRVTEDQMFHDNMTKEEEYETGRYYFGLGFTSPYSWGISSSVNLDIPPQYRSIVDYRTTLGHKVNHKFDPDANTEFTVVKHPLFGPICGLVATKFIDIDEELFVDYNYDADALIAPQWNWYKEAKSQLEMRNQIQNNFSNL